MVLARRPFEWNLCLPQQFFFFEPCTTLEAAVLEELMNIILVATTDFGSRMQNAKSFRTVVRSSQQLIWHVNFFSPPVNARQQVQKIALFLQSARQTWLSLCKRGSNITDIRFAPTRVLPNFCQRLFWGHAYDITTLHLLFVGPDRQNLHTHVRTHI